MYSVTLAGIHFHAPIGLYPEEQILGNDIEITISISRKSPPTELPLLDYEKIYFLAEKESQIQETTLENLLQRIVMRIEALYPETLSHIEIRKLHPPLKGTVDYAIVSWNNA